MPISATEIDDLAGRILGAARMGAQIGPITQDRPGFGLPEAYAVAEEVAARRQARGEQVVGWKIGFTNRTIWPEYGVHAPIWGPMWDTTVSAGDRDETFRCSLSGLSEPRIEPEIVLRLRARPSPDMDEAGLLGCIDAIGHGFEIVQSLFPGWRFQAADTVAAFALHGRYLLPPLVSVADEHRPDWLANLRRFALVLSRDGAEIDRGSAGNLLGGPLSVLAHVVRELADSGSGFRLEPGHLVSTGTVTRAFPVAPGETWSTVVSGLPLPGATVRFE